MSLILGLSLILSGPAEVEGPQEADRIPHEDCPGAGPGAPNPNPNPNPIGSYEDLPPSHPLSFSNSLFYAIFNVVFCFINNDKLPNPNPNPILTLTVKHEDFF